MNGQWIMARDLLAAKDHKDHKENTLLKGSNQTAPKLIFAFSAFFRGNQTQKLRNGLYSVSRSTGVLPAILINLIKRSSVKD